MAELRIIKNSRRRSCQGCGGIHEFITRPTENLPCDTPVAFPVDKAKQIAPMVAISADDVERIPTDTRIVLDDADRKLPVTGDPDLAHFTSRTRLA